MGEETQEDESGLLTIHDVTRAHAGFYECTADNGIAPPATVDVQLVVQCECLIFIPGVREEENMHGNLLYTCMPGSINTCINSCVVLASA